MEETLESHTAEIKELKDQYREVRGEVINLKGSNSKVTKRVDELERKWKDKFESAGVNGLSGISFKADWQHFLPLFAFAFLAFIYRETIQNFCTTAVNFYNSAKVWTYNTFYFLAILLSWLFTLL